MKERKNIFIDIFLLIGLIAATYYIYSDSIGIDFGIKGYKFYDSFGYYLVWIIYALPIVLIYNLLKSRITSKRHLSFITTLLLSLIIYGAIGLAGKKRREESINSHGQIICKAVVYDKIASSRGGSAGLYVKYKYHDNWEQTRLGISNKKPVYYSINKGDTVLMRYAVEYHHWNWLYRLHPTKEELAICSKDRFYYKGVIQDSMTNKVIMTK